MNLVQRTPVGAVFRYRSGGVSACPRMPGLPFAGGVLRLLPGYMLWILQRTASIGDTEE